MANPNIAEAVTLAIKNYSGTLADNITKNNAILSRLSKRGNMKTADGGTSILQELEYAENGTFGWYSGYESLDISPQDVFSAAEFDWKQAYVAVSWSGLDTLKNAGKSKMHDFVKSKMKNAERTMQNQIAAGLYADGTGSSGKEIGGLQLLVADTPTSGTVGGIDRQTYTWWRNYSFDATTDGTAAATSANIQTYMKKVHVNVSRGTDVPDLIIADNNYYSLYWASVAANQRFTSSDMAEAGFESLKFGRADVVLDGGQGGNCPTNHMYFLNTNYLFYRPHADRNMVGIDDRFSTNQDAQVRLIVWAGNMTLSNGSLQGLLKD